MAAPVLVIDFGSQVTQLIARRVREAGVYCEIVPFQKAEDALKSLGARKVTAASRWVGCCVALCSHSIAVIWESYHSVMM